MVCTERRRRKKKLSSLFEPTREEKHRWSQLPHVQAKCKALWTEVLLSDAALDKLCLASDGSGEYKHDPIAMTVECITHPTKFAKVKNPIWAAAHRAAQAQLIFTSRSQRYCKKYNLNISSIRRTVDGLTVPVATSAPANSE